MDRKPAATFTGCADQPVGSGLGRNAKTSVSKASIDRAIASDAPQLDSANHSGTIDEQQDPEAWITGLLEVW